MTESESVALPFGDSPSVIVLRWALSLNTMNYITLFTEMQVLFLNFLNFFYSLNYLHNNIDFGREGMLLHRRGQNRDNVEDKKSASES